MSWRRSVALLLSLAACKDGTPLVAYKDPLDAAARIFPLQLAGIHSCAESHIINGVKVVVGEPPDECYKFQPQRRYRGIWLDQFEGSHFFEGAKDVRLLRSKIARDCLEPHVRREWLAYDDEKLFPADQSRARLVALDFIGRRTAYDGSYGHFGMSKSEILVDRVISSQPVYISNHPYLEHEFAHCTQR